MLLSTTATHLNLADLIPVVVNMTQNTNASDFPIKNVINTVPSNATALQDIVKNNSNKTAQNEDSAALNNATVNNSNPSKPQESHSSRC